MIVTIKRRTPGFTLLELLISITIASLISALVFNIFTQQRNTLHTVDVHEDIDVTTAIMLRQLAHDLAGVWQPISVTEKQKSNEGESSASGTFAQGGKVRELTFKPMTGAFVASQKNSQLHELTFITENPLHRFVSPLPYIPPKPQMVRVTYEFNNKQLLRSESVINIQSPGQITKTNPIVVADNISSIVCSFIYTITTDAEPKVEELPTWDSNQFFAALDTLKTKKNATIEIPKIPPLPSMVKLRVSLWDKLKTRQYTYSYLMPIPTAKFSYDAGSVVLRPPLPQPKPKPPTPAQQQAVPQILVNSPQRAQQFQNLTTALAKKLGLPQ